MSNNKGIPTIGVRGIQFRSRIEAQWAYIFEKLEWNWEYEPIDLEGYIPDFIIKFDNKEILIEIKGDIDIWKEEIYKHHKEKIIKSGWKGIFGILGSTYKESNAEYWINIGKLCLTPEIEDDLVLRKNYKTLKWSLGGEWGVYDIINDYFKDTYHNDDVVQKEFSKLWVEAKNKVQWKGIQNKIEFKPNKNTIIKILEYSKTNEKGESYIKYDGSKYEGLSYEESQYFIQNGGISKLMDEIYDIMFKNLKTIKDVLMHEFINQDDKKRIMRCYEKIKIHYEIYNELPLWGNTDIFINNKAYIYKVNYDKSIQYLQTNDMNRYKKLTFDGVPQSPTEMNQNDFMEK